MIDDPLEQRTPGFPGDDQIISVVQDAINQQRIIVLPFTSNPTIYAGGTNMCPNSDFAFSHLAATVAATDPAGAGATNLEVYRVTRQVVDANISSQRLRTVEADAWIPIWQRVQGMAELGAVSGSDNYDVAFQLTNNWLVGNRKWYIRVAVATADDTPLPVGTKLFVGFWVKRLASQGWVTGGNFNVAKKVFGVPGTQEFNYKVIAKTDSGVSLESQILNVTDVPDVLDQDNYVRLTYPGGSGFIEFEVYREDVATGEIRQIARDRNSSKLVAYDTGQSGRLETNGFPAVDGDEFRAYAEVLVDAVSIDVQKTFHNLSVIVPPNFDTSDVTLEGTYLRVGIVGPTTSNRQVWIDTIWASETYNVWSPSPFDVYPSRPSTTMVTAPPSGGGGGGIDPPPPGGGHTCVWDQHDLRLEHGWIQLKEAIPGMLANNGIEGSRNQLDDFIDGEESQLLEFTFDCGLVIFASPTHRFIRNFDDHSGVVSTYVQPGDTLQGGHLGEPREVTVIKRQFVSFEEMRKVRSPKMTKVSPNKFYAVGDAETGWYVYSHNEKPLDL